MTDAFLSQIAARYRFSAGVVVGVSAGSTGIPVPPVTSCQTATHPVSRRRLTGFSLLTPRDWIQFYTLSETKSQEEVKDIADTVDP